MFYIVVLLFCCFVECINNASNQTTKQPDNQTTRQPDNQTTRQPNNKLCLEDITEQSESNPGQSLGITTDEQGNCLEDSTYTV